MKDEPKGKAANAAQGALGDIEELDSSDTQKHPVSEELSDPNVAGENEISQSDINSGSPSSGVDPAFSAAALHEPKAKHWSERIPIWRSIKAIQRQLDSLEARHQAQLHWHQHQLNEHRERANKSQSQLMRHQIKLAVQQDELNQYQEALAQTNERSVRQQEAVTRLQEALAQTDERSGRQEEAVTRLQEALAQTNERSGRQQEAVTRLQEALAQTDERSVRQQEAVTRLQEALAQTYERSVRQQEAVTRLQEALAQTDERSVRQQEAVTRLQEALAQTDERSGRQQEAVTRLQEALAQTDERSGRQQEAVTRLQEALAQTDERSGRQQEAVTRLQEALAQTDERSARQQEEINRYQDELNLQQDQLLPLQNQIQAQVDSSQELDGRFSALSRSLGFEHAQNPAFDRWYQNLQDLHRGSGEALAKAQASYLSYFEPLSSLLKPAGPILDLGCGRGEWLSLLANQGWQVLGVDSSELVVDVARENGLEVQLGDLLTVLEAQPANSLAAVTAFQVIEHLPFETIVALVHAAFRALLPGGILLLETPNPENIQVAAYSFWMDPTHKKPIPPPLIMDLSYHAGFRDGLVLRQNPWPNWDQTPAEPSFEGQMNQRLFGPQDYAVLAYKPVKTS